MKPKCWLPLVVTIILTSVLPQTRADTLQLVNGDTLNGEVLTLNAKEVKLKSEVLGDVAIARDKVVTITFGNRQPLPARAPNEAANDNSPLNGDVNKQLDSLGVDSTKATELLQRFGVATNPEGDPKAAAAKGGPSPEDVVKQLQTQGLNAKMIDELSAKFPLLQAPGVKGFVNDKISGLISGSLNIQDIRKDAIKARDGLLDIKKDLGPSGAALDGYLKILEGFIQETEPQDDRAAGKPSANK